METNVVLLMRIELILKCKNLLNQPTKFILKGLEFRNMSVSVYLLLLLKSFAL